MHYFREITVLSKFYEKLLLFPAVDQVARNNHLRCRYFAVAWSDGRKPQVVGHRNDAVPRSVTRYQGRLLCLHSVSLCYVCAWRRWRRLLRFPARFIFQDGSSIRPVLSPPARSYRCLVPAPFTGTGRLDKQPSSLRHAGQSR